LGHKLWSSSSWSLHCEEPGEFATGHDDEDNEDLRGSINRGLEEEEGALVCAHGGMRVGKGPYTVTEFYVNFVTLPQYSFLSCFSPCP